MCKVLSVFVSKSHFLVFYIYGQGYADDTDTTDFGVVSNEPWAMSDEIIILVYSSDAARNVPTPLTAHNSLLIAHYSSLTVKHFYFCPQATHWYQNEQKPLKIVQKQT